MSANHHLRALLAAHPFVHDGAFRHKTVSLAPHTELDAALFQAARRVEPRWSETAVTSLRDDEWLRDEQGHLSLGDVPLHVLLERVARRSLAWAGARVTLQPRDAAAAIARFRQQTLHLPVDLLVASLAAAERRAPPSDGVEIAGPQLAVLLRERPHALTHVHAGAGMSFAVYWTALMRAVTQKKRSERPFKGRPTRKPGADVPFGRRDRFVEMLRVAACARVALARCLADGSASSPGRHAQTTPHASKGMAEVLARALEEGPEGLGADDAASLRELGRTQARSRVARVRHRAELARADPLARALGDPHGPLEPLEPLEPREPLEPLEPVGSLAPWLARTGALAPAPEPLPETVWTARALEHLARAPDDHDFAVWFWQYQRIRNQTFRFVVHEPGPAGLDWFQRFYRNAGELLPLPKELELALALEHDAPTVRVESFEGRVAPRARWSQNAELVRGLARAVEATSWAAEPQGPHAWPGPEVGLVVHLLKEHKNERARGGLTDRSVGHPRGNTFGVRYGSWAAKAYRQAGAIARLLTRRPEALLLLRGLDVASSELAIPTWVVAPAYRRARQASIEAAHTLRLRHPELDVAPLRATAHAGEDYERLVQGVRRVHELVTMGMLEAGDRVGHALALGEAPERSLHVSQPQSVDERMTDLTWELERYEAGDLPDPAGRFAAARAELSRHLERLDVNISVGQWLSMQRRLHEPDWATRLGYPWDTARAALLPAGDETDDRLLDMLTNGAWYERARDVIDVTATEGEVAFVRRAQDFVMSTLARLEITVESNPSSNACVGSLDGMESHPALRMSPLESQSGSASLFLSINTDDPLCFATSLGDEHAHLYYALVRSTSSVEALAWLERAREAGWRSRFTLRSSRQAARDLAHTRRRTG